MAVKDYDEKHEPSAKERAKQDEHNSKVRQETLAAQDEVADLVQRHVAHPAGFQFVKATWIRREQFRVNLWCERVNEVHGTRDRYIGASYFVQMVGTSDFLDLTIRNERH